MSKSIKKSKENWNVPALNAIAKKYDFTSKYIKQCITGDRTPIFADRIKKEYEVLKKQLDDLLNNNDLKPNN